MAEKVLEKNKRAPEDSVVPTLLVQDDNNHVHDDSEVVVNETDHSHDPNETTDDNNTIDPYLVDFDKVDKDDPRQMSKLRRWVIVLLMTLTTLQLTMLNSVWSTINDMIRDDLQCDAEVALLGLAMFVLGLALGPLIVAPLSEHYGRKPLYLVGYTLYIAFQFPTAFGKNIASMVIGRFLTGFFGSVLLSNSPGSVADVLYRHELNLPMNLCGFAAIGGPSIGPLVGAYVAVGIGYRWVFYIFIIWSAAMMVLCLTIVPETYKPLLLSRKAARLRQETDLPYHASFDKDHHGVSLMVIMARNLRRPLALLAFEPMLQVCCFYSGFLMAVIYLFLTAFPMVFKTEYNFNIQYTGLALLGYGVGMGIAVFTSTFFDQHRRRRMARDFDGKSNPELRMPQGCVGAVIAAASLFIFAWTVYPHVHYMVPIVGSLLFGLGCNWTFSAILSYIVESYPLYAASATAANVFIRCLISTAFPLFSRQMMNGMGYHWAMSLIGFIAVALAPVPFLLAKYGHILRQKSRYAN